MKKSLIAAAALIAAIGVQAAPVVINIDNFDSPDVGPLSAALNMTASQQDLVRFSSITTLAGPADGNGTKLVIGSGSFPSGLLEVGNENGRDVEVLVKWQLAAGLLPVDATDIGFFLQIVQSDAVPTDLQFLLNDVALASFAVPGLTMNKPLTFGLTAAQITSLSQGGALSMKINGGLGWDFSMDQFGFSYEPAVVQPVPEPASLALVGLALAAAGIASRRKA